MILSRLGDYIEWVDIRNTDLIFGADDLMGISIEKKLIKTKANTDGLNLKGCKILRKNWFSFCTVTSRNGNKISVAYNDGNDCIISSFNPVFKIKNTNLLHPRYLMMFLCRKEFDRYARSRSWGSAREYFWFDYMCEVELYIPPIEVQLKYVDIYEGLISNVNSYKKGLDDLKLVYDSFIERLKKKYTNIKIGEFVRQRQEQNKNLVYKLDDVVGVSLEKKIIPTKADASKNDLSKFVLLKPNDFIYNPRNGIAVALNNSQNTKIISWNNTCFYIIEEWQDKILPEFLFMFLCRNEWNRKTKFLSWGSSTEVFSFESMGETEIPLAPIETQKQIIEILKRREKCLSFIEKEEELISTLCPILIRGSVLEAKGGQ